MALVGTVHVNVIVFGSLAVILARSGLRSIHYAISSAVLHTVLQFSETRSRAELVGIVTGENILLSCQLLPHIS